ncbi:MAG: hypothetical protein LBM64_06360 [Deltaproteobacteria bacterium]|nr:hypothetical protein [Deltaproteobacteria bacterium]
MVFYLITLTLTLVELALFIMLLRFFRRLQKSEQLLTELQANQNGILNKLALNASLERELMQSFAQRQQELTQLDLLLEERSADLRKLLEQAESVCRSPQFLRELILSGYRRGQTPGQLARGTGLSVEEVELILSQNA